MRVIFSSCFAASLAVGVVCLAPSFAGAQRRNNANTAAASKPTPSTPDGHPDLTGFWGGGGIGGGESVDQDGKPIQKIAPDGSKRFALPSTTGKSSSADPDNKDVFALNADANHQRRMSAPNQPPYKPELLAKVKDLDYNANFKDPSFRCGPEGVPRLGAPQHIYVGPKSVVFLYAGFNNVFREIPTDGRAHDSSNQETYTGDSIGHWEGDTLVVDSINFNDQTWLGGDGYFHSEKMHVVERLTRTGDTLKYEATVEDPEVFTRPWVMNPRTLRLNTQGPSAYGYDTIQEAAPCVEREQAHIVGHEH